MTGKERMTRILKHQPVDRIGLYEHFWSDTKKLWKNMGIVGENQSFDEVFGFDMQKIGPFNLVADIDFEPKIISETEDTSLTYDGNGATMRRHKKHNATAEHVDFSVKDRSTWLKKIKPLLTPDPRRINFDIYRKIKSEANKAERFFTWCGLNVFESIHPVCGHEYMLMGMCDDPNWVRDMAETYAHLTIELQKILFEREGTPDGIFYYEDMGYKGSPFMSPQMYRDIIKPAHEMTIEFAKSLGLPVIMHSCGYVEPLIPDMIDAGIDCLQVLEVKAGMDVIKLHDLYSKDISFMGGIDVRTLYTNDKSVIDMELESKIPIIKKGYNYVLHSDHSIPVNVNVDTFKYYIKKGLELGRY